MQAPVNDNHSPAIQFLNDIDTAMEVDVIAFAIE